MALKAIVLYREPFLSRRLLSKTRTSSRYDLLSFYQAEKSLEQTSRKEKKKCQFE